MTELSLVRHGETEWNASGRHQGQTDSQLSQRGLAQAEALAERWAREGARFDAVYSSDLGRAMRTAEILVARIGGEIRAEESLRERGLGIFEGLTYEEIDERYPEEALLHRSGDPHFRPEGGESYVDLYGRSVAALREIARRHDPGRVLVVTHGGVVGMAVREALGIGLAVERRVALPNAGVSRLAWDGSGWWVWSLGDVAHLAGLGVLDETVR
jgi:2,3-bisphosphoglycerate-dependent phosphoglycerate mutase